MGAAALGVRNLLMLTGDDPKVGDQPDTKPVFDLDSKTLSTPRACYATKANCRPAARSRVAPNSFLGAADVPIDPKPDWQPTGLAGKIAAGAQFAQTQFCMDAGVVRRYVGRLAEAGLTARARHPDRHQSAALGEIGALDAQAPVRHHHSRRDDRAARRRHGPGAEGRRICVELIEELAEHSRRRRRPHHGAGQ